MYWSWSYKCYELFYRGLWFLEEYFVFLNVDSFLKFFDRVFLLRGLFWVY